MNDLMTIAIGVQEQSSGTLTGTPEISQSGHLKPELIQRLTELQKEINNYSQRWTENKIEAGKILLQLREGVPHGEWEPQLKEICKMAGIGRSTAHRYMDLAEGKNFSPIKQPSTAMPLMKLNPRCKRQSGSETNIWRSNAPWNWT